jgi:hypothetical protein
MVVPRRGLNKHIESAVTTEPRHIAQPPLDGVEVLEENVRICH